jgi:hypothetical protein
MKKATIALSLVALAVFSLLGHRLRAAGPGTAQTYEYGTLRWDGKEHTHFVRPSGQVEFLGPLLTKVERPDKADERALLLTIAVNAIAQQGFEVVCASSDTIVFKRPLNR